MCFSLNTECEEKSIRGIKSCFQHYCTIDVDSDQSARNKSPSEIRWRPKAIRLVLSPCSGSEQLHLDYHRELPTTSKNCVYSDARKWTSRGKTLQTVTYWKLIYRRTVSSIKNWLVHKTWELHTKTESDWTDGKKSNGFYQQA